MPSQQYYRIDLQKGRPGLHRHKEWTAACNTTCNDEANEYYAYVEERAEVIYPDGWVEAV